MNLRYLSMGLVVGAVWLALRSLEQHSLYIPQREWDATPDHYRLAYENFTGTTEDGVRISGWFLPGNPDKPTLLLSHGNAGNISHRLDKAKRWHDAGFNVCLYDYRGYGHSQGTPSEQGTYHDADAVYNYLVHDRKIPVQQIVIVGESLGCAVAVELACSHPALALILESPFTSTIAMAHRIFPWLPARWIIRYRYDNLAKIFYIQNMPLLIMHSPTDEIVPYAMGRQLFNAASSPKQFFDLTGGHNDGYAETGPAYVEKIKSFLSPEGRYGLPHQYPNQQQVR